MVLVKKELKMYSSKDGRVYITDIRADKCFFNIQSFEDNRFFERVIYVTGAILPAENKIKAIAAKAKKLTDDISIQNFLAAIPTEISNKRSKMKTNILLFIAGALLRVIVESLGSIGRKID